MLEYLKDHWWSVIVVLNYMLAISAAVTIILKNINPTKTLSYIIVLVIFPFLGIVVYYFFGQEYRKTKIFSRKHVLNQKVVKAIDKELELKTKELEEVEEFLDDKSKLVKLLHNNSRSKLTRFNDVKILINGEQKFDYLLNDLKNAKHHIHIEYYIIKDDIIGSKVISMLCQKAEEGVKVRVSFDAVGSKISFASKKKMKQSGVEFHSFMPVRFAKFTGKMNYRNHRKIAIIDGVIGYTGGINVSDNYLNYETKKTYWRDTHIRIKGESVRSLQILFLTTWEFVSEKEISVVESYFPKVNTTSNIDIQIAASGPDTDWANIMEAIFTAITNADKYIYITTPYFIPNDEIITAIQVAARCGIDVRLMIPKESDSWTAEHATNSYIDALLEADVKIYRYARGFVHAKTMVIDDIFCSIGTANMDYRSFNINFEVNALIYNETVSKDLKTIFLKDIKDSEQVQLEAWRNRSQFNKLQESFCRLWAPLL